MPQFPIISSQIQDNNKVVITDKNLIKHIVQVLRLKEHDELLLIDENEIEYKTTINTVSKQEIIAEIIFHAKSTKKLNFQLDLLQSTLKSTAMEFVIQKATELGVKNIYSMPTFRSVSKFNGKDVKTKLVKWETIAKESCKQCERADVPNIEYLSDFEQLKELAKHYDIVIACIERKADDSLKSFLHASQVKSPKILVIIGPEGGFEDCEIEFFKENNFKSATISNLILRAETAAISALSGVIYEYEF